MNNHRTTSSPFPRSVRIAGGFTLVEMLVVISVIGIMIGILIPVLAKVKQCAYLTGELAAGRSLAQAHRMYSSDFAGNLMAGFASSTMVTKGEVIANDNTGTRLTGLPAQRYPWRLLPYFEYELGSWYRDKAQIERAFNNTGELTKEQFLYAVSVAPRMGLNQTFIGGSADTDGGGYAFNPAYESQTRNKWGSQWYCRKISDLKRPSEMIVFATSFGSDPIGNMQLDGLYRVSPPYMLTRKWTTKVPDEFTLPGQVGGVSFRYALRSAVALGDGHAETYDWTQMQDMRHWSPQATKPDWTLPPL